MRTPVVIGRCQKNRPPSCEVRSENEKTPPERGFHEMRRRGLEPPPGYPGPGPQPGNRGVICVHFASERPPSCAGADDMDWSDDLDVATNVAARARRRCTSAQRWTDRTCRSPMYVVVASRDERSLPRAGVSSAAATGDRISRKRRLPSSSGRNVCCSSKAVAPDLTADAPACVLKAAGCPFDAP
jgi:hypothetical protein